MAKLFILRYCRKCYSYQNVMAAIESYFIHGANKAIYTHEERRHYR